MLRLSLNPAIDAERLVRLMIRARKKPLGKIWAKLIQLKLLSRYSMHINTNCTIGENVQFPHPIGIVIGEGVVIEDNVTIYQHVTIGRKNEKTGYPIIQKGATLYTNAVIAGEITIGENAIVGANALVFNDVAADSIQRSATTSKIEPPH